ncbi:Uncharacterized conserved protein [Mycobacteroides abscessus subsp. abscessus]|uniref:AAA family ATPase n=1 Tax=Mycobacteroides abscessus TaxID=36809 RepID=UPI000926D7C9|nr:DUF3696 domain-containing protein [Mycobacteroides abscessus]SIK10465.1 Uncharacterized conserved protein [Mycobacteroides abscessus subsp. abscessus]
MVVQPWRVTWTNFRGYENPTTIDMPALTLLIGRNNVGKTTAYAPLLLLRQTLNARNNDTALLFRGDLMDFGSYKDVVTDHDQSRQISLSLDLGQPRIRIERAEGAERPGPRSLEVTFAASADHPADLVRSVVRDAAGDVIVRRSRSRSETNEFNVSSRLLPTGSQAGRPLTEVTQIRKNMRSEQPEGFMFTGVSGLRLPAKYRHDSKLLQRIQGWMGACNDLYDIYVEINYHVRDTLRAISYLGPLRSPPQRSYQLSAEPPDDVGRDGQWAPEVLYQSSRKAKSGVLARANEWLAKLGYGELSFSDSSDEFFQVMVKKVDCDVKINLADCGAGLSQLLPLLVQGCVMKKGDTLIAQQPEIHLNPAQQDLITDFLVELCESGRRVIIETHSEHVLGRLRRRIAEGETIGSDDVGVYFCESKKGRSTLRPIPIGQWGEITPQDWPEGFFGEQLENSMAMAMAQVRRKQQQGREDN